jgi:hypothetical protein
MDLVCIMHRNVRNTARVWSENLIVRHRYRWKDNIQIDLKETVKVCEVISLSQDRVL